MTQRDAWARLTPYEVGIPGREFAERHFGEIREEAEARSVDLTEPGAFLQLGQVGRALREIQGGERGGEAIHRFGAFLFHSFHFHGAGEPLMLLQTAAARYLVEGAPTFRGWSGELPGVAGYIQLPRHLFWSKPEEEEQAEPLDGIFWTRTLGDTLSLLVAMGIRDDRPGISVMELPPVPLGEGPIWMRERARDESGGEDFATTLPGGELDRLYSVVTLGEALKLTGRVLAHVTSVPGVLGEDERAPHPSEIEDDASLPRPSLLPFRRIGLAGGGGGRPETGDSTSDDEAG